jgi:ABC-2 type transport system permease protein
MQQVGALFPLKWLTQGMRSAFLPDSFASNEVAGSWELASVALVLVAWAVGACVLALLTFGGTVGTVETEAGRWQGPARRGRAQG